MKLFGFALILLAVASVSVSSEGQLDSIPDANDISFLQAGLQIQQPVDALTPDHVILVDEASSATKTRTALAAQDPYALGTSEGSDGCPSGYTPITDATECSTAATTMGWHTWNPLSYSSAYYMKGCTQEIQMTAGVLLFNTHPSPIYNKSNPVCKQAPTSTYFPACSSARCFSGECTSCATKCNLYTDSGCPSTMTRPWVMCKDDTGVYHCRGHGKWENAKYQSGRLSTAVPCVGEGSECCSAEKCGFNSAGYSAQEYTESTVDEKLSYCSHEWCQA